MRLSQLTTLALVGVTLGTGFVLGVPHVLSPNLPVMAQANIGSNEDFENNNEDIDPSGNNVFEPTSPTTKPRSTVGRKQRLGTKERGNLLRDLNLSSDQMQRLRAVQQQYKSQLRDRRQEAQQARQELERLQANSASADTVRSKSEEVRQLKKSLREIRSQKLLAMRELLTSTQRQQLDEKMRNRPSGIKQNRKEQVSSPQPY